MPRITRTMGNLAITATLVTGCRQLHQAYTIANALREKYGDAVGTNVFVSDHNRTTTVTVRLTGPGFGGLPDSVAARAASDVAVFVERSAGARAHFDSLRIQLVSPDTAQHTTTYTFASAALR